MDRNNLLDILELRSFVALDFETTGLSAADDRIIEVAAIRFEDGEPAGRFVTLLNPGRPIAPEITDITGITNAMVAGAPHEKDVVSGLLEFLGEAPLVAHNIAFDWSFLNALGDRHGASPAKHVLYDTLQLSRTFLYFRPAHNLASLAEYFGLSAAGSHRAETDTENCGRCFIHLLEEAASYPLEIHTRLLAVIRNVDLPNKAVFVHLANHLTKTGELKRGLTTSRIEKEHSRNRFSHRGARHVNEYSPEAVFSEQGVLNRTLSRFEARPGQRQFAEFVEQTFDEGRIGVVEAGTGLGKSLAYLYPVLKLAGCQAEGTPVVISCYTRHLQDQLFYRDLPLLTTALDISLDAVMLKGRNNYICLTRLDWLIASAERGRDAHTVECLLPLVVWLRATRTGDLSECVGFWSTKPGRLAALVQCESGFCTTSLCNRHKGCFFGPLRKAVYGAQVIVVNHALLLTEVANPGLLPPFHMVVIDEAHDLIDVAYNQFTISLDHYEIVGQLSILDPQSSSAERWYRRLQELSRLYPHLERPRENLRQAVTGLEVASRSFFEALSAAGFNHFNVQSPYPEKRVLESLGEEYSHVDLELQYFETALKEPADSLQRLLAELRKIDSGQTEYPELFQLFDQARQNLLETGAKLTRLTRDQRDDWVYWQEGRFRNSEKPDPQLILILHAAPVDVARDLSRSLFANLDSAVLASATLRVDESFEYFLNRTGLDTLDQERVVTAGFESPFHYRDQVKYYQLDGDTNRSKDPEFIADLVYHCHKSQGKRTLVLFTSWAMLTATYRSLRQKPEGRDLPLFAQHWSTSRYALLKGMAEVSNGILMGTTSFWEGVDLPGELLEILIITKLPFDVPSEPIVKAYSQMLNAAGRNAFLEFAVPEAVTKFRQGFGRLIRTSYDQGLFIVLDERILTKQYGRYFQEVIPTRMHRFRNIREIL